MKRLAIFDFDGTLTTRDSFLAFIRFYKGWIPFGVGMIILSPVLILYKLKVIPNWRAKEYVLTYFFKGEEQNQFNKRGVDFALAIIPKLLRRHAVRKLKWHIEQKHEVVVITASATNWVKPWTDSMGIALIATELKTQGSRLTGKISGKNCYGPEKVTRLCYNIKLTDYSDVYVYGDSKGDKELLDLATKPFFRKF